MASTHRRTVSDMIKAIKVTVGYHASGSVGRHVRGGGNVALATFSAGGTRQPLRRDSGDQSRPAGGARGADDVAWQWNGRRAAGAVRGSFGGVQGSFGGAQGAVQPLRSSFGQDLLAYIKAFGAYR